MLHSLEYSVTFPTGRKLEAKVDFRKGLTAVTGRNEAGKSFLVEMVRYGLWGTKALRGAASDYKTLTMSLTFSIKGRKYEVTRSNGKALLTEDGTEIATGTRPVNERIIAILGYDITVFDVANACLQGQVEALGDMRPEQRKQMVDQTIGLTLLDDIIKWVGSEANAAKRSAETLEASLVEPQEPERPADYVGSDQRRQRASELQVLAQEYHSLAGALSQPGAPEPHLPVEPCADTLEQLELHQLEREKALARVREINAKIAALGTVEVRWTAEERKALREQIEKVDRWERKLEHDKRYPKPSLSLEQIEELKANWRAVALRKSALQLEAKIAELRGRGTNRCPECQHEWPLEAEEIARLEAELAELPSEDVPEPTVPLAEVEHQSRLHESYQPNPYEDAEPVDRFAYDPRMLEEDERAEENARQRAALQASLMTIEVPEDRTAEFEARRQYEWALENYEQQRKAWQEDRARREVQRKRMEELSGIPGELELETQLLERDRLYEAALESYQRAYGIYRSQKEEAEALKEQASQYAKARSALQQLKVRIKQHLVPSLNRVASHLLHQMTGGQRNTVHVDEDFNITIDGQALNTLSGSGKAVANLAIRIGLGQVLTNKVFSVFLADEIDAAMDEERAAATAACLRNLTQSINQVILVSHKRPEADHIISL